MVTTTKYENFDEGSARVEFVGLSTDAKPAGPVHGKALANGSAFLEMDTGDLFLYDGTGQRWLKQ